MYDNDQQRASEDAEVNAWTRSWMSIRVQESIEHYRRSGRVPQKLKPKLADALDFIRRVQGGLHLTRTGELPVGPYSFEDTNTAYQLILDHQGPWKVKTSSDVDDRLREFSAGLEGLIAGTPGLKLDRTYDFFSALFERDHEHIEQEIVRIGQEIDGI